MSGCSLMYPTAAEPSPQICPAPHLSPFLALREPERRVTLCLLSCSLLEICSQPWQKLSSYWSWIEIHLLSYLLLLLHFLLWHHKSLCEKFLGSFSIRCCSGLGFVLMPQRNSRWIESSWLSTFVLITWTFLISWTLTLEDFVVGFLCSVFLFDTCTWCFQLWHGFLIMCSFCLFAPFKFFYVLLWFHFFLF